MGEILLGDYLEQVLLALAYLFAYLPFLITATGSGEKLISNFPSSLPLEYSLFFYSSSSSGVAIGGTFGSS